MNRIWITGFVALCALAAAPFAFGQEARKASVADTATIQSIDADARTFTVEQGAAASRFRVDAKTRILRGGKDIAFSELAAGDRVVVTATEEGTTTELPPVANQIEVVIPGAATGTLGPVAAATTGPGANEAVIPMQDQQGNDVGEARLMDTPNGLLIHVKLHGLPPGEHGFHVHETGKCESPFTSAGGHLAPQNASHGFLVEAGPHAGDLPNLFVGDDGRFEGTLRAPQLQLATVRDADGGALIVHAGADDYRSQPSGAAGDRIACGEAGSIPQSASSPSPEG